MSLRFPQKTVKWLPYFLTAAILTLYLAYVFFVIQNNRGPIDYEIFMEIGTRLRAGNAVYTENSYYPLPYVVIFAAFSALPRPVSMAIWLLLPVAVALMITRGKPYALLYAPTFGHFVGGQSSVFGLLGFWGYRRYENPEKIQGGLWLALTLLKPQLAIIPCIWAGIQWVKYFRMNRKIPVQVWGFLAMGLFLYIPSFVIMPDWPLQWLSTSRPLFYRAMSGLLPRLLIIFVSPSNIYFWVILFILAVVLLTCILRKKSAPHLQLLMLWGFIVSPLVHDYDLIQILPLLEDARLRKAAIWVSIPAWLVIAFAYSNNDAWFVFTLFAPILLLISILDRSHSNDQTIQVSPDAEFNV